METVRTGLDRASPFGFTCARCRSCCRFKKIQINPYEIARMAGRLGISTTDFISHYTTDGGSILRFDDQATCIFLNDEGCALHSDRPLVCRLYPLGRFVDFQGRENFAQLALENKCRGRVHESGTIAHYLEEQGAAPFMHAADCYLELLKQLLEHLQGLDHEPAHAAEGIDAAHISAQDTPDHDQGAQPWIDLDRALIDYCRSKDMPIPDDIDARMQLHIKAIRQWMA